MIFGLKRPKIKSRIQAIFIIIILFIAPLVVIMAGIFVIPSGDPLSNEQAGRWAEDILYAVATLFSFGLYLSYGAIVALIKNDYGSESDFVVCMNCHELFKIHTVTKMICPKCTGVLENLDGFFIRHPELADKVPKREEKNATRRNDIRQGGHGDRS